MMSTNMNMDSKNNNLKLISLNVRGIREKNKRKAIFEWCKNKKGDIIMLQETFSTADVENSWKSEWNGTLIFNHGTCHSKGILIMLTPRLKLDVSHIVKDVYGRFTILKGTITGGTNLLICNVYFPTRNKEKEQIECLDRLDNQIQNMDFHKYSVIIGGDFNMIRDGKLDHVGHTSNFTRSRFNGLFEDFVGKYDLEDIWRKRNPHKMQFTFRQKTPIIQSRLDYWFISTRLEKDINMCDITTSIAPDHSGIRLEIRGIDKKFEHGRSYWKFNNSLCLDGKYVDGMKSEIARLKTQENSEFKSKSVWWDYMKMKMRQYTIKFSKEKAKSRKNEIKKLEIEIQDLEEQLVNALVNASRIILENIEGKKDQLKKLHDCSIEGLKVRSRASWVEEGEKNTDYFVQLLQSNKRKSLINELFNEKENRVTREKDEILHLVRVFYENLYSQKEVIDNFEGINKSFSFFKDIPKLDENNRKLCEGNITKKECVEVLKEMKCNKAPGNDGFTTEFYCTFWHVIGEDVLAALNEAYAIGELSASQKQGVITLIEKKEKDSLYVKNYRPITLLNVDYKILSKVLAKRIKEVLSGIIHTDQVGYMKDRNIGEAVRLIDDVIFHSNTCKNNSFLLAIDFEKAFDSVSHSFLFKVLKLFGFGTSFCKWVQILYTQVSSCIMNGGHSTGYFQIQRGVRQGDPLSPYLFLLVIEILANAIRKDNIFKGFNLGENEIRQVIYADDVTIFAKDVNSVRRLEVILEMFWKISGLKVNKDKTSIFKLNNCWNEKESPTLGKIVKEVKILGIYFSRDVQIKEEMNYKEILSKIKKLLGWWKQRDLTMMGRIHLLKTYALSKLIFFFLP